MSLPEILSTKDPADFFNQRVRIKRMHGEDFNKYIITTEGPWMNFMEMQEFRKQETTAEKINQGLDSKEGYLFANLGLSSVVTLTIDNENYAVVVEQQRPDLEDTAAKLISGYVDVRDIRDPLKALDEEIAEEFLPCDRDDKILSGIRDLKPLPRPFKDIAEYESIAYQMIFGAAYAPPDLDFGITHIDNITTLGTAKLYYQVPSNSAQLIFSYHIDFPRLPHIEGDYLQEKRISLHHSEDKFNPEKKTLDVRLHKAGALLIQLSKGELTDKVRTLEDGELKPYEGKVTLSEAFAPKELGAVTPLTIPLKEYVENLGK